MALSTFEAIGISGTGFTVHRKWMDAISDNMANQNSPVTNAGDAYRAKYVAVQPGSATDPQGVYVDSIVHSEAEPIATYEPDNPLANEEGYVYYPNIDLAGQMSQLMLAQRGYQANAAVVERSRAAYEQALQIGRN